MEISTTPMKVPDDICVNKPESGCPRNEKTQYVPKLRLKDAGIAALITTPLEDRVPLHLNDIQALLLHCLLRTDSPLNPTNWATVEKSSKISHITLLVVEGITADDYIKHQENLEASKEIFQNVLQVLVPNEQLIEELVCVQLSDAQRDILVAEYGSLETAMKKCTDKLLMKRIMFETFDDEDDQAKDELDYNSIDLPKGDKFPRTQLLLSPIQMINEGYPLPLTGSLQHRYVGYTFTNDCYAPVHPKSPMFGVDCEMCRTSIGVQELTRVSIVDEEGNEFYESLVRPQNKIVDYLTEFSGITPEMMKNVTKTLPDVHRDLKNKFPPDAILVGQSLQFDLNALKLIHPYVIDTSVLFNLTGTHGSKTKLKVLTKKFLARDIQSTGIGHDSIEDSWASLELVKLKLSNSVTFGDQWLQDRNNYYRRLSKLGIATEEDIKKMEAHETVSQVTGTLFGHARKKNKKCAVVTRTDLLKTLHICFKEAIEAKPDLSKTLKFLTVDDDMSIITQTIDHCLDHDFNLSYIKLKPRHLAKSRKKISKLKQIDGWIRALYEGLTLNGMLLVVMAGGEVNRSSRTGVAMVEIKQ